MATNGLSALPELIQQPVYVVIVLFTIVMLWLAKIGRAKPVLTKAQRATLVQHRKVRF